VYAVWELTLRCDLSCRHCGSRAGRARPHELSTAQALDLVRELAALGVREVTVIGGEAYLRDDWLVILASIRDAGMLCAMTTGGRGMSEERATSAAAAGLVAASVSLDGLEETHDRLRGVRGSFRAALAAADALERAGVQVSCNSQINRANMGELPALLDLLVERRFLSWQLALTVPMGRAADAPGVLLQPHDLASLFPVLAALAERAEAAGIRFTPANNVGYFGPYEALLRRAMPVDHTTACGAGCGTIGIEADGTIKGCPSLPTDGWAGGRVTDDPLESIWERAEPVRRLRDEAGATLWGFCATCYYAKVCRGGCTWTADAVLGRPGNNPYCHHRVLELAKRGLRERIRQVEEAPGLPFDRGRFELIVEPLPGPTGVDAGE